MNVTSTRTRLSPEARRDQLLDSARAMVLDSGLQAFTMEGLAKVAGVSAPLVYNYFPNRPELLQALLIREYQRFVDQYIEASRGVNNFEDIVRISVTSNFDHHAPGHILPLLMAHPETAAVIRSEGGRHGHQTARFLVRMAAEQYHLDQKTALLAGRMSSGASIAAADLAASAGLDREDTIALAVNYILAGIERISRR